MINLLIHFYTIFDIKIGIERNDKYVSVSGTVIYFLLLMFSTLQFSFLTINLVIYMGVNMVLVSTMQQVN